MSIAKIIRIIKKNYPIAIVALALVLVAGVTLAKVFAPSPKYVYVKVRLGQGLWWAGTLKPNIWFTDSLKKGEKELNIQGEPTSEILEVRHYPYKSESSKETLYNVFLTVKLAVNVSRKTEVINYSKYPVIVGAPIEFEFPSTQVTGTIIEVSREPFPEQKVEKTVYLAKRYAYPWEYDAIKVGDKYFDGEENVFEVLDKSQRQTLEISPDAYGNITQSTLEPGRYVVVKARIKVTKKADKLIFGEEQLVIPGAILTVSTLGFDFDKYIVSKVE